MKLVWSLAVIFAFGLLATGQTASKGKVESFPSRQIADMPYAFFGPFKINGEKPKGLENFDYFILGYKNREDDGRDNRDALLPDTRGVVAVRGQVSTNKGNLLDFESVSLVETGMVTMYYKPGLPTRILRAHPVTISFSTVEMKGIRYAFNGEYLDEPSEEKGAFTYLRGVLSKFKKGNLVAEARVGFVRVAYEELSDGGGE